VPAQVSLQVRRLVVHLQVSKSASESEANYICLEEEEEEEDSAETARSIARELIPLTAL